MADVSAYAAVLAGQARAQRSYRTNFAIDLISSGVVGLVELAEVWILFHNVTVLGGLTFTQMILVFGLADVCYSVADLVVGHVDRLPRYIRTGTLDVFYLRPQPLLAQLIFSDISLRRITRLGVGVVAAAYGLHANQIDWSPAHIALLVTTLLSGIAITGALFVLAAGCQFWLVDGAELTNSFVYGGRYASTQPATVWPIGIKVVFGAIFPVAFVAFVPAMTLLGRPVINSWIGWCAPLAAGWIWAVAMFMWRAGVRHYQGGGG